MKTISLALGVCALMASPLYAQSLNEDAASDTIVVTATRAPASLSNVGSAMSVIDANTLEQRQIVSVVDALRDTPGLNFNRNGGPGSVTSVRIRGAEADQTVLLIDGVKLNDPSAPGGGFDFGSLLVGDLDRIEVLRGPQSTLYGSQAIGGVINLITRAPEGPWGAAFDIETGELQSHRVRARVAGGGERFGFALAAGTFETEGVSALDARAGGNERDGYEHRAASARARANIAENVRVEAGAWWSRGAVGIDGFPAPLFVFADTREVSTIEERILNASVSFDLLDGRLRNRMQVSQTRTDRSSRDPDSGVANSVLALGENERLDFQTTFDASKSVQFIAGWERESAALDTRFPSLFDPNPMPTRGEAKLQSVYAQVQATPFAGLSATAGLRHADDHRFGDAVTLRATLAYSPNNQNTILRASVGDGFKAPTPFQLFSDFGNPTLAPEEAYAWDVGVEQGLWNEAVRIAATYFHRTARNQIDFVSCFGVSSAQCLGRPFGVYDNVARTRSEGVELNAVWAPNALWRAELALTALNAENRADGAPNFARNLPRRPERTAALSVTRLFAGGHDLSLAINHVGDSFDDAANTRRLKSHTLAGVRGAFAVTERWSIYGRVENVTDEAYQTAFGYGALPRQAFVGVRAAF